MVKNMKETMMQFFEWYLPEDQSLWKEVKKEVNALKNNGFTMVWLPPAYKGQAGQADVGYGVYDMYDLGEFCAKGSIETKYGSKEEYIEAVDAINKEGMISIGDIVLNHRMGSDESETARVQTINDGDRNQKTSDYFDAKVWTKFTFPERDGKYSDFQWDKDDFTGTDYDANTNRNDIIQFEGKEWSENVSHERGNFDYIMGADVDFSVPEVVAELYRWGSWYTKVTGVKGFRLDAIKSIDARFFIGWLKKMKEYGNHPDFAVGEFWTNNTDELVEYLKDSGHCMKLFDVPLHYRLMEASNSNGNYDIRHIFDGTLSDLEPDFACAFSDNHDTQPGQALESWVSEWFKPAAYALILLNRCQYPCVFYGDYYGIPHDNIQPTPYLREMVWIRKNLLSDSIVDFNDDDGQKMCWLAPGEHPVVVILTIADYKEKEVNDLSLAKKVFVDLHDENHKVYMDEEGKGLFSCGGGCASVYILEEDYQKMKQAL